MDIKDLEGKLVAVLGYGQEGKAVTRYLLTHSIKPVLFDQKEWPDWPPEEQAAIKNLGVNFIFGPGYLEELKGFDVAFRSPGIRLFDLKTISKKTLITSQTKWFFEHCPAKIIGVTGTKGKGTTCSLIYSILSSQKLVVNRAKPNVYLTGNIGKQQPLDFLDDLSQSDWVVYELSSFQLQDLAQSPHIGVVLMTTSEHLDYHRDQTEYLQAKQPILQYQTHQDFGVIDQDNLNSRKIGTLGMGQKKYFSIKARADSYVSDGQIFLARKGHSRTSPLLAIQELQLRGRHNWENVCAAALAAACAGCLPGAIKTAIKNFKGLEHRLEFVAEKQGIKFYNDSFSTTPETAMAALASFVEPEIVILGGSSKNSDFTDLGKTVTRTKNLKAVILIGQEASRLKKAIIEADGPLPKILEGAASMEEIFKQLKIVAAPGDAVILSPACASFDMFKNYQDRGRQFKQAALTWV